MKFIAFLSLAVLLIWGCGNGTSADGTVPVDQLESTASFAASPDQDTARYAPLYIHKMPAPEEINNSVTALGGFGQVLAPPMTLPLAQLLTSDHWVVRGYADLEASRQQRIYATGQWLRFFDNGTFQAGHWDRQTHAGAWYLNPQGKHPRLTLDSNVDALDAVWEIQGYRDEDIVAVRLQDPGFGAYHRPFSARWMKWASRPTKKQFADFHGPGSIR